MYVIYRSAHLSFRPFGASFRSGPGLSVRAESFSVTSSGFSVVIRDLSVGAPEFSTVVRDLSVRAPEFSTGKPVYRSAPAIEPLLLFIGRGT
ncbi:hypothetical protein OYT88_10895 [Sporolactobacillus sp. CQH2019]|uniref:hypothetical protein n=1 Tax=Sporolactobacillus sp. CQH2019 TaxID=3023512 RepID=UPI002367B4F7|nr:hypothetical protein [Sporolactobacillus sp. CQH2019]MDD9149058.1 hypothetical protein [Sporolactobacillus sp. CQH2019]